jgi:hypothetical protein
MSSATGTAARLSQAGPARLRIATAVRMSALDLARNRVAMTLLIVAPVVLFAVVWATTGEREIPFELSAVGPVELVGSERQLSLLFIALTAITGVSAFLGFLLVLNRSRPTGVWCSKGTAPPSCWPRA